MRITSVLTLAIAVGILGGPPVYAQVNRSADNLKSCRIFAEHFYSWYVPLSQREARRASFDVAIAEHGEEFAPKLLHALQADADARARVSNEIVGLDFDPFLGSQDTAIHYEIRPQLRGDQCDVAIHRPAIDRPDVIAEVVRKDGHWKFFSFRYPNQKADLLTILASLARDRKVGN